jgi:PAS domain S-box-containing protein
MTPGSSSTPARQTAQLVREKDWGETPLGPIDRWPRSLRVVVETILPQPLPAIVLWGPELVQVYNEGYAAIAAAKHPKALGQPTYECWPEISDRMRPVYDRVLAGESVYLEGLSLTLLRTGLPEETFLTVAFSPLKDDDGRIAGILAIVFDATAKVKAERERLANEAERERLAEQRRLALEAAQLGWWLLDPAERRVFCDARLQSIFGHAAESIDYEQILALVHPDDRPGIKQAVAAALDPADPRPYTLEYRVIRPDGSMRRVESRGHASFVGEGDGRRASGLFGTVADVTEARNAEVTLRENEQRLSLALAAAELGTWDWDPVSDRITLSDRAAEVFGLEPGHNQTRTWMRQLLHEDDREPARAAAERAGLQHGDYDMEYRVNRRDGTSVWVAAKGRGLYDAEGRLTRMLGVIQDITIRKQAEQERERLLEKVESERARLSAAFMQSPAFMCILRGPEHVLEFLNEEYSRLIGNRDILGKPIRLALPELEGQGYLELLDRIYAKGERFVGKDLPVAIRRRPNEPPEVRHVDFVYQPIHDADADGSVSGIFVHGLDITEVKQAMDERQHLLESERAARAEAERSNRMKDEFLATLSHELRTPLNAIIGWSYLLSCSDHDAEDLAEGIAVIGRNGRAQAQIIDDLLDMNRIVSGKVRLDLAELDPGDVVRAGIETIRPAAEEKGVRIATVLDPRAGRVMGDASRLQQVIWNLLSNAVKFTPKGGQVQVALGTVGPDLEIRVSDSGIGIRPEFLSHVFDRFRQADSSTTRKHGGLGLGLAIAKHLVELHGGSVRVESPGEGRGATFTVALPILAHPADGEPGAGRPGTEQDPSARRDREQPARLSGVRVLVVDDEPDARAVVKRLLEDCRAIVQTAGSASEALGRLRAGRFDVLVSDVGMPGEDGHTFIRRVRALGTDEGASIPALALTAYARPEDRLRAIAAGFNKHAIKPIDPSELIALVASLAGIIP